MAERESTDHPFKVFISSTLEDMKPYRAMARDAALSTDFFPVLSEYFAGNPNPVLETCYKNIDKCDLLIVIVGYRYGWVSPGEEQGDCRSITRLECEYARDHNKDIIAFIVDEKATWAEDLKESYALTKAVNNGTLTSELSAKVQKRVNKLKEFKEWLKKERYIKFFENKDNLQTQIVLALTEWRKDNHPEYKPRTKSPSDPKLYFQWLNDECGHIDIRGLKVGEGKAHRFGIEEIYIPLTTSLGQEKRSRNGAHEFDMGKPQRVELSDALTNTYTAIIGDPGAGKTTFIRRIAYMLMQEMIGSTEDEMTRKLKLKPNTIPVFIRIGAFSNYIAKCMENSNHMDLVDCGDSRWLLRYLDHESDANNWNLTSDFFKGKMDKGEALLLFDGLDEAPDDAEREKIATLVNNIVRAYGTCRCVVTSRPQAYEGMDELNRFKQFTIDSLESSSIETFIRRWCEALFAEDLMTGNIEGHFDEIMTALRSRIEIRRMATNPVMLTALAVVHWNEKSLPEQRADLYESIINWLLKSREKRPGRTKTDLARYYLSTLALAMQMDKGGRKVQVGRRYAAELIADKFEGKTEKERINNAEHFLSEEELDSGIVVKRGNQITFWHLTFQEYLAALAIGGEVEKRQKEIYLDNDRLHDAEWREVWLLYVGVLYGQGPEKVNDFFRTVLTYAVKHNTGLSDEARCVGLIGAMLRDLSPYNYKLNDARYKIMLAHVEAIFDRDKYRSIDLKIRVAAADALGQAGDPRLVTMRMITIPACTFKMGAEQENKKGDNYDELAFERESPVHTVHLSEYRISRYLITVAQFEEFMENGGYTEEEYWSAGGFKKFTEPENWAKQLKYRTRPVVGVSWYEAMAYCVWKGVSLPTEAQWERAAKGSGKTYRKYPWGDAKPDGIITNSAHNNLEHPTAVGMFPEDCTNEGVMDMGGNVWEWCLDYIDINIYEKDDKIEDMPSKFYKKSNNLTNPVNIESGELGKINDFESRVIRGGSFYDDFGRNFRCASRVRYDPHYRGSSVGFRVVSPGP